MTGVVLEGGGGGWRKRLNSKFDWKKAEIIYDKDTLKIENKLIFLFLWKLQSLLSV